MDLLEVVADLRNQLEIIDQAISALENMSTSQPRRRERPRRKIHSNSGAAAGGNAFSHHSRTMSASRK